MNFNSNFSNPSFKGRREDINNIKSLSDNNMPILPNKRQLILSAIDNVSQSAGKEDIEMLMGTVETMKYGIRNNSEFAKALGGTNGEKENTDWDGILQNTIQSAINNTGAEDKEALQARFQKIFGEEKPLSEEEKQMLDLRSDIMSSKEMTNVLNDSEKTVEAARISQNLDYFIASSEINTDDKIKCLGLMKHFLSDDYEIHPQLKDYKVQAFSEMVNDLIIKRPDEEAYTIKDVSQRQTGMCAAISIARKTIAYEDKVRAMEIMMAELDNKPTMEVYDRTDLGSGKKVQIEKAHVDFTDGIKKGYRIIDTGTHQWMNAANVVGNGSISVAHYQAFDPDNYEIFRDAKWLNDLPEEYQPAQNWLRYLQKEEGAVKNAQKRNLDIAKVQKEIGQYKKGYEAEVVKSDAVIRETLMSLSPDMKLADASNLTRKILKADKLEDKQFKLINSEPKEQRNAKLAALIKSELPNVSDEAIAENIDKIADFRELSASASKKLDKLKEHSTPQAIFSYNKNLYTAAAHHRRSVQAELNIPDRLNAYEKHYNVPVREGLVQDAAQSILSNLSSPAVINNAAEKFGVDADASAVKNAVEKAITTSEIAIPAKLDEVLGKMGLGDRTTVVTSFLDAAAEKIKSGDSEVLQTFAENAHTKPDASNVLSKIEAAKAELANNPSNKQIAEAVSLLGYNNQIEMTADMYKTFTASVNDNMKKQLFGDNAEQQIADLGKDIKSASDKQAQIEKQFNIPSRKDIVLGVLEAMGEVVPEKTLQEMQDKFDKVAEVKSENDNRIVDPGVKKPKVPDSMYKFTPAEKKVYAQIEANLPNMQAYAKINSKAMNKALAPQLDALYAEAGRLDGHLWVGKEGESGLYDNQSIKVLEMITGKHYYNEEDIDKVVEHIKRGEGSGTSSTNVDHTSYSGHAQYVEEVSQVAVIDPETKETVMKDVLWHDNTWGKAEDKDVWTDEKGVKRTSYSKGYGGPDGYVFDSRLLTGTFVEDQKYTPGVLKTNGQKFDLWKATRIAGENPKAQEKLDKVMKDILQLGSADKKIAQFEKLVKASAPVDMKLMDNLDNMLSTVPQSFIKRIENANIKTQADLDKINNKEIKFLLDKTALQMSAPSESVKKLILNAVDEESLAKIKTQLPEIQREMMAAPFLKGNSASKQVIANSQAEILNAFNDAFADGNVPENLQSVLNNVLTVPNEKLDGSLETLKKVMIENADGQLKAGLADKQKAAELSASLADIITKTIDEKLTINSVEDFKKGNDTADLMIKYVDKKFNTSSDAELLNALQKLQNMSNDEFNAFMADSDNSDLGIKDVDALDVARQINAQKGVATETFTHNARVQVLLTNGPQSDKAVEWQYRKMKMDLAPVKNSIDIGKMKNTLFEKHGIRAAFPETVIMDKQEITEQVTDTLDFVKKSVAEIEKSDNKSEAAAELNYAIKNYVSANVEEKYQSKAAGLINSYVKALRKGQDTDKIYNDTVNLISQGHITQNPTELLQSYIKEVQSENPNVDKLAQLREYMTYALNVSEVSNVEYGLIDNAANALETMTNSTFDKYKLKSADGQQVSLDSDQGILFLANKLANPANDSTALQVFFAHTGLSERAVDVISKSVHPEAVPAICQQLEPQLKAILGGVSQLKGSFTAFAGEKSVSYSSYKDALKHYVQTLDKEYENKSAQEKQIYSAYRQFLVKTENADFAKSIPQEAILPTLSKIHEMGMNSLSANAANGAQQLNTLSETIQKRLSAMKALKLPKNSDKEAVRQQFVQEAETAYSTLAETIKRINEISA